MLTLQTNWQQSRLAFMKTLSLKEQICICIVFILICRVFVLFSAASNSLHSRLNNTERLLCFSRSSGVLCPCPVGFSSLLTPQKPGAKLGEAPTCCEHPWLGWEWAHWRWISWSPWSNCHRETHCPAAWSRWGCCSPSQTCAENNVGNPDNLRRSY